MQGSIHFVYYPPELYSDACTLQPVKRDAWFSWWGPIFFELHLHTAEGLSFSLFSRQKQVEQGGVRRRRRRPSRRSSRSRTQQIARPTRRGARGLPARFGAHDS